MFVIVTEHKNDEKVYIRRVFGPFGTRKDGNNALENRRFGRDGFSMTYEKGSVCAWVMEVENIANMRKIFS